MNLDNRSSTFLANVWCNNVNSLTAINSSLTE